MGALITLFYSLRTAKPVPCIRVVELDEPIKQNREARLILKSKAVFLDH